MTRYWISWWQPGDDPRPLNSPPKDARVLGWWRSGTDGKRTSICALVTADVSDTALAAVAQDWPESTQAEVRFVEPKSAGWTPSDRFPLSNWMKPRIDADGVNPSDQTKEKPLADLTERLQQKCSDWGTYWRAPDAHGVVLTQEQALELLRDALGVEVEIVPDGVQGERK